MSKIYVDEIAGIASPSTVAIPGHVIQVVSSVSTDGLDTLSTTYADLPGMSVTITPTSTSSKVVIFYTNHVYVNSSGTATWQGVGFKLLRDTTTLTEDVTNSDFGEAAYTTDALDRWMTYSSNQFVDTPSSTSAITYKLQGAATQQNGSNTARFNWPSYGTGGNIMAMEIAG